MTILLKHACVSIFYNRSVVSRTQLEPPAPLKVRARSALFTQQIVIVEFDHTSSVVNLETVEYVQTYAFSIA